MLVCVFVARRSNARSCLHSNLGWLYYGILKTDQTLIVVNIIGALLQILYIFMYLMYTKHKVGPSAA